MLTINNSLLLATGRSNRIQAIRFTNNKKLYVVVNHPNFCQRIGFIDVLSCNANDQYVNINDTTKLVIRLNVSSTKNITYEIFDEKLAKS